MANSERRTVSDFASHWRELYAERARRAGVTVEELEAAEKAEREAEEKAEREAVARRARDLVINRYGARILADTAEAFLAGDFEETLALKTVKDWVSTNKSFLLLHGGTGAGKTLAALFAMIGEDAIMVRSPDLGPAIEPWKSDGRAQPIDPSDWHLFVLDDLGIERAEDARWATSFDELIDARQGVRGGKRLRTIITTNLTIAQIKQRYSERAVSRISASYASVVLPCADMRRRRSA